MCLFNQHSLVFNQFDCIYDPHPSPASTPAAMNAIVIRPDNSTESFKFTPENNIDVIREQIGEWVELIPHPQGIDAPITVYVNGDNRLKKLPANFLATFVMESLGYKFCTVELKNALPYKRLARGPVVFVGKNGGGLTSSQWLEIGDFINEYL